MWRLKEAGYVCTFRCAVNEIEMRAALRAELPDHPVGLQFARLRWHVGARHCACRSTRGSVHLPSGTIGEERAIEALKCGAMTTS